MDSTEAIKRTKADLAAELALARERINELEAEIQRLARNRIHGSTLWHVAKISLKDLPAETIASLAATASTGAAVRGAWAYAQRCVDQAMQ